MPSSFSVASQSAAAVRMPARFWTRSSSVAGIHDGRMPRAVPLSSAGSGGSHLRIPRTPVTSPPTRAAGGRAVAVARPPGCGYAAWRPLRSSSSSSRAMSRWWRRTGRPLAAKARSFLLRPSRTSSVNSAIAWRCATTCAWR